jgi:(p)ppGpp synthase/HD superfamily hydrolase
MLSDKFIRAVDYACRLHAEQTRKGSEKPYVAHLLGVASIVFEYGGSENEAIAGLLHDAIEDQGGDSTRKNILAEFGKEIVDVVDGCTDADTIPKPPWKERKLTYIRKLSSAPSSVHLVSASDKLYNARAILADYREIGDAVWGRFKEGKDGTLWYYRSLVNAFKTADLAPKNLIDELDWVVTKIEKKTRAK